MLNYIENHLTPGENIVRKARKSMTLMARRAAVAVILLVVGLIVSSEANNAVIFLGCLLAAAILLALKWLEIRQYELVVTNRKIAAKTGLISKTVQDCPLDKIDTVVVQNNLLGAMCGYGTVVVKAVNGTFRYTHIVDATGFKDAILNAIGGVKEEEAAMQARKLAEAMRGALAPQL